MLPGAGHSGSRIAHSASVTDDEYTAQPCPPAAWGGHDGHGEIGDDGIVGSWSGRGLGNHRPNQEPTSSVLREAHARPSRVLKHSLSSAHYPASSCRPSTPRCPQVGNTPNDQSVMTFSSGCSPSKSYVLRVASAAPSPMATAAIIMSTRRLPPGVRPAVATIAHSSR